jgi:hypothetical protein
MMLSELMNAIEGGPWRGPSLPYRATPSRARRYRAMPSNVGIFKLRVGPYKRRSADRNEWHRKQHNGYDLCK